MDDDDTNDNDNYDGDDKDKNHNTGATVSSQCEIFQARSLIFLKVHSITGFYHIRLTVRSYCAFALVFPLSY